MNKKIKLSNFEIKGIFPKLLDKWGQRYFKIIADQTYFCFAKSMTKNGWETLTGNSFANWDYSSLIIIEYKKVRKNNQIFPVVTDFCLIGC